MEKVDIIIVNWNSGDQLRYCIESIRLHGAKLVGKCIVVDNASHDGSTDFLTGSTEVDLVHAGGNLGFGAACNLGAARGESSYILLLNPDAALFEGSLARPLAFLEATENKRVGIVGVQLVDESGSVQRSCARLPTPWRFFAKSLGITAVLKSADFHMKDWDHAESRTVGHVMGAFYLMRRELFEKLGGLDERFFVYLEDLDFSQRANSLGYFSVYLADTQAFHKGGGVSEQVKAHRLFYSLRSRIQYAFKHFSNIAAVGVTVATLCIEPVTRLVQLLFSFRWREIGDLWRGYKMLWLWVFTNGL